MKKYHALGDHAACDAAKCEVKGLGNWALDKAQPPKIGFTAPRPRQPEQGDSPMNDDERKWREWAKNVVRGVPSVPIRNTEYVPTFKRRTEACIDRATVLLALEHDAAPDTSEAGR